MNELEAIPSIDARIKDYEILSDRKVLCCLILNEMDRGLSKVFRTARNPLWVRILIFFLVTGSLPVVLDASFKQLSQHQVLTILSLALISTSVLAIVKYLRNMLFPFFVNLIVEKLVETKEKEEILHSWLERYANIKNQIAWSSLATIMTNGLLVWAWVKFRFPLSPGVFMALGVTIFLGTQLPFWTFGIIQIFKILSRCKLKLYSLNPSQDEKLIRLHGLAMLTLFLGSLIVLFFTVASYIAFFRNASTYLVNLVFLVWYILGLLFAIALFLFPTIYTSQIIITEKRRFLADLQSKIEKKYSEMKDIEPEKLAQIEKAWNLHQMVEKTPNSFISWNVIRTLVGSIGIQSLPVFSSFIDWQIIARFLGL